MDEGSRQDSTDTESLQYEKEDDLFSECDSIQNEENNTKKRLGDMIDKGKTDKGVKMASKSLVSDEYSKEEYGRERFHLLSLDAYSRHKKFINDYLMYYGGNRKAFERDSSKDKTDHDILEENHQFLWEEDEEDEESLKSSWGKRLARKYYDKLFKEYCIADLSLYKKNKIAMRWRVEKEVVCGKGQFLCGEKHCGSGEGLRSWEVNFAYREQHERKNALVKLRLCPKCSCKLNHHHKRKEIIKKSKNRKRRIEKDEESSHEKRQKNGLDDGDDNEEVKSKIQSEGSKNIGGNDEKIWSGERLIEKDKSKEEEFEEYFEDIFL